MRQKYISQMNGVDFYRYMISLCDVGFIFLYRSLPFSASSKKQMLFLSKYEKILFYSFELLMNTLMTKYVSTSDAFHPGVHGGDIHSK